MNVSALVDQIQVQTEQLTKQRNQDRNSRCRIEREVQLDSRKHKANLTRREPNDKVGPTQKSNNQPYWDHPFTKYFVALRWDSTQSHIQNVQHCNRSGPLLED